MSSQKDRTTERKIRISDAEWEVMTLLWEESPLSSYRIVERLSGPNDWKPKTIKTLLSRLVKKGFLDYEVEANRYLYFPKINRQESLREESLSFLQRVFRGDAASMLLHFVKSAELSMEERDQLRALLDEMESET